MPTLACALTALALLLSACASAPVPTQPRTVSMSEGKCTQPAYPSEARRYEAQGSTTLAFDVNAEGKVTRVAILEPSGTSPGHRVLDTLALETLQKCVFPATPGFLSASSKVSYLWKLAD